MHELALAQSLVKIVCEAAQANNFCKVTTVAVVSGELVGVVPDALEFGFEVLSQDTLAQGAKLEIRQLAATIKCSSCGFEYSWQTFGYLCPQCSQLGGEMIQGNEFYVDYIEGETKEEKENDSG